MAPSTPNVPVTLKLPSTRVLSSSVKPSTSSVPPKVVAPPPIANCVAPVTPNVPVTLKLPSTLTLSRLVYPSTSSVPPKVVLPITLRLLPTVASSLTLRSCVNVKLDTLRPLPFIVAPLDDVILPELVVTILPVVVIFPFDDILAALLFIFNEFPVKTPPAVKLPGTSIF